MLNVLLLGCPLRCYVRLQLAQAVGEAKASSILNSGSVQLAHVGSYLRSRHGYLVAIRHANVIKRPRAYLRMLQHTYLVVRGLEGLEGECGQALHRVWGTCVCCWCVRTISHTCSLDKAAAQQLQRQQ